MEALKGDEKASKGNAEAIKGGKRLLKGDGEVSKGNGDVLNSAVAPLFHHQLIPGDVMGYL